MNNLKLLTISIFFLVSLVLLSLYISTSNQECQANACSNLITFDVSSISQDYNVLDLVFIFDETNYIGSIECIETFRSEGYNILGFHSTSVSEDNLEFSINPLVLNLAQHEIEKNKVYDISSLEVYTTQNGCELSNVIYEEPDFSFSMNQVIYPNGEGCPGKCFSSNFVLN